MTTVATYPKPVPEHAMTCHCEECQRFVEGLRVQCAHCQQLFRHDEVRYRWDDTSWEPLCEECQKLPVCLCWSDRLRLGLVTDEEICNWNAFHDF